MNGRFWLGASRAVGMTLLFAWLSSAQEMTAEFDVNETLPMHESTTDKFSHLHPSQKTVRGTLTVSLFVPPAISITDVLYQVYVVEGAARIVDYYPRTRHTTMYAGDILVTREELKGNQRSLKGSAQVEEWIGADAILGSNQSNGTNTKYHLRAPQQAALTTGTNNRGRGVYFHFQQSPESALPGERQLEIEFRVPASWRGGYLRVVAQASDRDTVAGESAFLMPIYLEQDKEAAFAADQLVYFERRLRTTVAQHADQIDALVQPTLPNRLWFKPEPIPDDWMHQSVWQHSTEPKPDFTRRLPPTVRRCLADFSTAKRLIVALDHSATEIPSETDIPTTTDVQAGRSKAAPTTASVPMAHSTLNRSAERVEQAPPLAIGSESEFTEAPQTQTTRQVTADSAGWRPKADLP